MSQTAYTTDERAVHQQVLTRLQQADVSAAARRPLRA